MASEGLVKVGALWRSEKNPEVPLTGKFGEANLIIMKNKHKKDSKHPDYILLVSTPQRPDESKRPPDQRKDPRGHNEDYHPF